VNKPNSKIPKQSEIWLVKFPKNKEGRKPFRPCVIISNDNQNKYDEEVIIMPLTTEEVITGEIQPFEIPVMVNSKTGLKKPSRILTNRIHTIDKELRLIEKLGKIDQET
jgi:mRNA-degrading endonuclease toxin of MazEF toxin-antitoxin module